jgi:hypothetical protein
MIRPLFSGTDISSATDSHAGNENPGSPATADELHGREYGGQKSVARAGI